MKRLILTLSAALVLVFGLSVFAAAQSRPHGGGGGGGGGQAAPRSGGGGGSAAPRSSGGGPPATAPAPRGGSPGGMSARPRGENAGSPGGVAQQRPGSSGRYYGAAAPRSSVYGYGRPGNGYVVLPNHYHYHPYYYAPYAFGAWGLGYWGYAPYWWGGFGISFGWGYPYYGYGWGAPYYGGYPYYGYGYNYGYSDPGSQGYQQPPDEEQPQASNSVRVQEPGNIKLKVKPKEAEVYVDGYYMGQVDDFDGTYQSLKLESGAHRLEIRAEGYQPLQVEIKIDPGHTVTYQSELKRLQ